MQSLEVIDIMTSFLKRKRPPAALRGNVDLDYRIEGQSLFIFEIRPVFNAPGKTMESAIAKATFVKSHNYWKVFWKRADLKWHSYPYQPVVLTIREFVVLVERDQYHCFWG